MEGDCNVYAHSSLWMRPTRPDWYNAKMVYISQQILEDIVLLPIKKKKVDTDTNHICTGCWPNLLEKKILLDNNNQRFWNLETGGDEMRSFEFSLLF